MRGRERERERGGGGGERKEGERDSGTAPVYLCVWGPSIWLSTWLGVRAKVGRGGGGGGGGAHRCIKAW